MNVYVYYDVPLEAVVSLASTVRAMQATLREHASRIDLLRRPESKPTSQTWMEVYEDVSDDFDLRLAASVAVHGLGTSARHVERFMRVD